MFGGNHFKKKMDKKARKKEAKKSAAGNTKGHSGNVGSRKTEGGGAPHSPSSGAPSFSPLKPKHQKSTLKGPVVDYGYGESGDRDVANDRKGVPFRNQRDAKAYQMQQHRGTKEIRGADASPRNSVVGLNGAAAAHRSSLASSQAQRRRVLRRKGGEDLLSHFKAQLSASTFRLLNEELYNSSTAYGAQLLREEGTFRDYHTGYRQQLAQWPVNPNRIIVESLQQHKRGHFSSSLACLSGSGMKEGGGVGGGDNGGSKGRSDGKGAHKRHNHDDDNEDEEDKGGNGKGSQGVAPQENRPSKRGIPKNWVIADMGCGEAQIAEALLPHGYTVHSFDLYALNDRVTVADTSKVPLEDSSVDVCVFSLSLMATDYEKSVLEALRILKPKGLLKIIEVRSRIPSPQRFGECIASMGCVLEGQEVVGDYFVAFDFTKQDRGTSAPPTSFSHPPGRVLLPSMYKKR